MTDTIRVRGIRAMGRHGVLPHEERHPQPFVVDLDVSADLTPAAATDHLDLTIDYGVLVAQVRDIVEGEPVALVERLADVIAARILANPLVEAVRVTVHKPSAPVPVLIDDVAVEVCRARRREVVIALGANIGDRARVLTAAVRRLACVDGLDLRIASGLVETDPVGGPAQPDFLNAVVVGHSRLHPATLLRQLHGIEAEFGRTREVLWGPRTLDLDLVQMGDPSQDTDIRSDQPGPVLPHPRAFERGFVLVPWLDADPTARLRVGAEVVSVSELVARMCSPGQDGPPGVRPGPAWSPAW